MGKLLLVYLLLRLTGSPLVVIIIVIAVLYFLDRRFVGVVPTVLRPMKERMRISSLRKQLAINPHDTPTKLDLAQSLIDRRQYKQAMDLLQTVPETMRTSADVKYPLGLCQLGLGRSDEGTSLVLQALSDNPRLMYGEPWLKLAGAWLDTDPHRSLEYLERYQQLNQSSCESEYRMGQLLSRLGDISGARAAWRRCIETYRTLPRFRKRHERVWAARARLRILSR